MLRLLFKCSQWIKQTDADEPKDQRAEPSGQRSNYNNNNINNKNKKKKKTKNNNNNNNNKNKNKKNNNNNNNNQLSGAASLAASSGWCSRQDRACACLSGSAS
ncbi:unnamed protein product [Polarella glacialis]|uniref:Uncharacterized protein n=1 Tax=Polarella glacialis TaxID=89957 RepID=A0A813DFY5_POLGL|nr:unnamed protein product [Polarella glacialis]CAE8696745.1 unnamed protein product [Polarella glacialis]